MDRKYVQVLGVLLLLAVSWTRAEGAITCTIPTVSAGDGTNVTCDFPQDIRISKNNIKVQRQPFKAEYSASDKALNVLECHWLDQQTFNCEAQPGYKLIGQVSNRAVVGIPTATRDHEGKYTCEVVPSEASDIQPCYFHLKEELNAANVANKLSQLLDELVELRHEVAKGAQEEKSLGSAVLALVVVCIVAIVLAALLYVFQQRVREILQGGKPSTKPADDTDADLESTPLNSDIGCNIKTTVEDKSETADPKQQTQANIKSQENDKEDRSKDTKGNSENKPAPGGSSKGAVLATVPPRVQPATDTARNPVTPAASGTASSTSGSMHKRSESPGRGSSVDDTELETQKHSTMMGSVINKDGVESNEEVVEQTAKKLLPTDNEPSTSTGKDKQKKGCTVS